VIWYCDLRGFTRASDRLSRDAVITLLNDYFTAMGEAVTEAGGEILKFMGDGMLAMFPIASADERAATVARAVWAAAAAAETIGALNVARAAASEPDVRFGLALHLGEVMFGNIGASKRLDFTVIGPAVNYAARLEKLCAEIGCRLVLSSAIADLMPANTLAPLGCHRLKDIDEPQLVFGLQGVSA
jgi:adenylate cyclase